MFKGKKLYWIFQLAGWGAFFLWGIFNAWSFERFDTPDDRVLVIKRDIVFFVLGVVMTHCLRTSILQFRLLNKKISGQILWIFIFTTFAAFITGLLELYINTKLAILTSGEHAMANKSVLLILLNNAISWLLLFIAWNAIYFTYHYIVTSQKEQIDNLKLKSHIKELELKTIKSHINPHFIFNSLNGIRAMVDENPQRARRAITELSNILRSSINLDKSETIVLADELNIIKDYLALEQMRFEDRLTIQYDISEDTTTQRLPPMMLQMLVENAIKHGINHEVDGGIVKLTAIINEKYMHLMVTNTGKLKELQPNGGFGLKSIKERLELLYGNNAALEISQSSPDTVSAKLKLPVI